MGERWVTFDCYGTLVDWNTGFSTILRPVAGARTSDLLRAYHHHEPRVEAERPFRCYKEVLTISLSRAAAEIGMHLTEEQTQLLPHQWSRLAPFDDAQQSLVHLRAAGYKLAVLTNCDEDLFAQTRRSFAIPFDEVVTAEKIRDYKPSPSHFRFFEQACSTNRNDWVHVGCSWFHDIEPARNLGIKHVWLDRDRISDRPPMGTMRVFSAAALPTAVSELQNDRRWSADPTL
jgi:2-haloacid dehalogenase